MKVSLDGNALKEFFIQHGEKIVLGLVLFGVVGAIYLSVTREGFDESVTPDQLKAVASQGRQNIDQTTWEAVKDEPDRVAKTDYAVRVKEAQRVAQATPYRVDVPWDMPLGRPGVKREDPEILKPEQLEVAAAVGPIAVTAKIRSRLAALEDAPPKKKKRRKRSGGSNRGNDPYGGGNEDYGSGDETEDDDEGGFPGLGGGGSESGSAVAGGQRRVPASEVCGYRPGGTASSDGEMEGGGLGGPGGGLGGPGGGLGGPGGSRGGDNGPAESANEPVAVAANVIAVKALFPFKKQQEIYKQAFSEAVGYDPGRDRVDILFAYLQRADVTDDPDKELTDADFENVRYGHTNAYKALSKTQKWAGVPAELVDTTFVDPETTLPCPPLMLRCLEPLMLHSKSPKRGEKPATSQSESEDEGESGEKPSDEPSDVPGAAPGDLPGGLPGLEGDSGGYAGAAGGGYPGGDEGEGEGEGMEGSDQGGMEGMMGGYYGSDSTSVDDIEYKLVRMYDVTAKPGRKYRYRIRVLLRDPNNPNPPGQAIYKKPSKRYLAADVVKRLESQAQEAAKKKQSIVPFWRDSGWSEPSPVATLPDPRRVAVGPVEPARTSTVSVAGNPVQWERSGPRGKAVPIVWSSSYATDLAAEMEVKRGTVLNAHVDAAEIIEPVSLVIKLLKDAKIESHHVVLDLEGGVDLPTSVRKERISSLGEYLVMGPDGSLTAHNELDDEKDFRLYRFDFPESAVVDAGAGGMGGLGGFGAGGGRGPSGPGVGQ